jgi:hypothetical protein
LLSCWMVLSSKAVLEKNYHEEKPALTFHICSVVDRITQRAGRLSSDRLVGSKWYFYMIQKLVLRLAIYDTR